MQTLVTGGNGHLGINLVGWLRARGHAVRASVRDLADPARTAALRALGGVELVEADVRDARGVRAAMQGVDCLFHTAAVYSVAEAGRGAEIIDTALRGTEQVLRAAAAAGVRQVVMTSSVVTLPLTEAGAPPVDESCWAEDLRIPYFRAKLESERLAWRLAEELSLRLSTVLPAGIIGPGFARRTPTIDLILACRMGEFRLGAPRGNFGFVDVRDVCEAHGLAAASDAGGRFIVGYEPATSFTELVRMLGRIDPRVRPPLLTLPGFAAPLLPWVDAFYHRVLGTPRIATPEVVASTVSGKRYNFSCARARRLLGWRPQVELTQSLADTLAGLDALRR